VILLCIAFLSYFVIYSTTNICKLNLLPFLNHEDFVFSYFFVLYVVVIVTNVCSHFFFSFS
jgi:hypothetical protein